MKKSHFGLTALELLIALCIVIILALAGLPGLREYRMNQQMKSAIALLASELKYTRNEAISLNTRAIICPATDGPCNGQTSWHQGWLVFADQNDDRQWQDQEPVLRRGNSIDGLTVISSSGRTQIRYFPGGAAPGSNANIVFCDQRGLDKGQKIVVSNSGRIRVSNLSDSDVEHCMPDRA